MPIFSGSISYAPFPEGFSGDMDETFQQSGQLAVIYISGNFLTGQYLPPGSTLPNTDQGPIAMGGVWYFYDTVTGQYLPQTSSVKVARNFARNCAYQVAQTGTTFNNLASGRTSLFDMCQARTTAANILNVTQDSAGLPASSQNDFCPYSIKYTSATPVATLAATDMFVHEHLIEGIDIAMVQGQILTLSFSVWVSQTGNYSAYIMNTGRDMSYVFPFTMAQGSSWARIVIPNIPAMPTGTGTWSFSEGTTGLYLGVVMAVGAQYQTATPSKWVPGQFAGTNQNGNMVAVGNNQIKITGIKLEASQTATYLSMLPFPTDLEELIRYYWTSYNYQSTTNGAYGITLIAQGAGVATGDLVFPRRMCKQPTITVYSPATNTAGTMLNLTTSAAVTAFAVPGASQKAVWFNGAITTPASAKSDVIVAMVTADARLT